MRGNVSLLTELAGSATRARGRRLHRLGSAARTQEATRWRGRERERGAVCLPTPRTGQALTTVATLCLVQEEAATQNGRRCGVRRRRLHSLSLHTGVLSPLPPCLPKPLFHQKHKSRIRQQEGRKGRHTHSCHTKQAYKGTKESGRGDMRGRRSRGRAHSLCSPCPRARGRRHHVRRRQGSKGCCHRHPTLPTLAKHRARACKHPTRPTLPPLLLPLLQPPLQHPPQAPPPRKAFLEAHGQKE